MIKKLLQPRTFALQPTLLHYHHGDYNNHVNYILMTTTVLLRLYGAVKRRSLCRSAKGRDRPRIIRCCVTTREFPRGV